MPFSQTHADQACNFIEKLLKHSADEWWGQPFLLCPWQDQALSAIFGTLDEEGNRLIEMVYLEVPKKAGKTEFVAAIVLLVLVLTSTPGCQVYGAAAATRQALNVYRAACKMVEQSPILKKHLRILRGTNRIIKRKDPDSFYAAIAADGDFGDGVNPAFFVADEVHRWKTRKQLENWDVLSKGGITRRQTLTIAITTAGVREESPLAWRLHEKTRRIEEGIVSDPRFYGKVYAADPSDDPSLPSTWIKANPSLKQNGGFLDIEKIKKEYETAASEGSLTSFRRYFTNVWDQKEERAIDMQKWDTSAGGWKAMGLVARRDPVLINNTLVEDKVRPLPDEHLARFVGRRCWAGVDLSMTTDFTAIVFLFPCDQEDEYDALPFVWFPDSKLKKMEVKLGVPLAQWESQGFLELSPGDVIDYRDVRARLEWGASMFDLREICWDPWNSRQISVPMIEDGYKCIEVRQGYQTLNEPTKKLLEMVARGKFHHGGHPVFRWHAGCACTATDGRDNIMFSKPDREKTTSRIDLLAGSANGLSRAMLSAHAHSVYETRGVRTIG